MSASRIRYLVVFCCISLYGCCMWLRSSFMPIIDALKQDFDKDQEDLSTLAAAFFISYTLIQIPSGLLLQIISSEIAFIVPTVTAGILSQIIYISDSFQSLIIVRVLMGISCSMSWIGTLCLIQQYFSLHHVEYYPTV